MLLPLMGSIPIQCFGVSNANESSQKGSPMTLHINGNNEAYCPECTEILGTGHWCYNCGYDPYYVDYKAGELAVADWDARFYDYSDFDFDDVPF